MIKPQIDCGCSICWIVKVALITTQELRGSSKRNVTLSHLRSSNLLPICPTKSPQRYLWGPTSTSMPSALLVLAICVLCISFFGLYINPSRACVVSPITVLPIYYVFFGLKWKSLAELPLTVADQLLNFLSKPFPKKYNSSDHLVCLQLTLKPPLTLFLLTNQRLILSP